MTQDGDHPPRPDSSELAEFLRKLKEIEKELEDPIDGS